MEKNNTASRKLQCGWPYLFIHPGASIPSPKCIDSFTRVHRFFRLGASILSPKCIDSFTREHRILHPGALIQVPENTESCLRPQQCHLWEKVKNRDGCFFMFSEETASNTQVCIQKNKGAPVEKTGTPLLAIRLMSTWLKGSFHFILAFHINFLTVRRDKFILQEGEALVGNDADAKTILHLPPAL